MNTRVWEPLLAFAGGIAVFLFGMNVMGEGLRASVEGRTRERIGRLCGTPLRGVLLGAAATAVLQSSSAAAVTVVGLADAGLMTLPQAAGVIMGANVGTTATAWLPVLAGAGGGGGQPFLSAVPAPLAALTGAILLSGKKKGSRRRAGAVLMGFYLLLLGLETMSGAMRPLSELPWTAAALTALSAPLPGLLAGAVLTALLQSSSAVIGILGAASSAGTLTVGAVIPIVMGLNIGTCVTTLLSAAGASDNARRAALIHLYFNLTGAAVQLAVFFPLRVLWAPPLLSRQADAAAVAVIHTLFNLISLTVALPLFGPLLRLAEKSVGKKKERRKRPIPPGFAGCRILDERFLDMPDFALTMSRAACSRMGELTAENLERIAGGGTDVADNCALIEGYCGGIREYLARIAAGRVRLNGAQTRMLTAMMAEVGELGRMGELSRTAALAAASAGEDAAELRPLAAAAAQVCRAAVDGTPDTDGAAALLVRSAERTARQLRADRVRRLTEGKEVPTPSAGADEAAAAIAHIAAHARRIVLPESGGEADRGFPGA